MNDIPSGASSEGTTDRERILRIAIMALGGQGGGVLTNWITELAEANGYRAQATSVAGVAQRTGATIYYIEMSPRTDADPVYALSPSPGDVDVMDYIPPMRHSEGESEFTHGSGCGVVYGDFFDGGSGIGGVLGVLERRFDPQPGTVG